jgi:DNA-binding GntR family transcriptional regulator
MCAKNQVLELSTAIRNALLEATVADAAPLTEQALADRFGVSRTPIREILRELESDGIIERRQRRGIRLRRPSPKELVELYDVRAVLEGYAARVAARRATAEDIEDLAASARRFAQYRERRDVEGCEQANIEFHDKIIEIAANDLLEKIVQRFRIIRQAFRITHGLPWDERDRSTPYPHDTLVELIRQGDADACDAFMRSHILRAKEILLQKVLGLNMPLGDQWQIYRGQGTDRQETH